MSELPVQASSARPAAGRYNEVFVAQLFHGVTALAAVLGLVLQIMAMLESPAYGGNPAHAWWNLTSYFSVQAGVLVFIISLTLFMESAKAGGTAWRAVRVMTLVSAALVLLLQFTPYRGLAEFTGLNASSVWGDRMLHYVAPILVVACWLIFGPRPRIAARTVLWSLVFPVFWLLWTLIRGAATGWYPYAPVDAGTAGTVPVLAAGVFLLLGWLGTAFLYLLLDRRMGREPDGFLPGFGSRAR
ncbi:Pr6Pr family membrane protein [Arthrobacter mobilis]|uniref:Pr6Pr family membrane protein n=1 Tax=Arthrobacter mobilis TaxID=2724944 RepID=A0A7X6K575_9MICC|nr:Pr6Pr family membrane protein [Arthrobacter mobilis]NKX53874.1 Pr6Pr family membrane protein [Arthrobacter mobilis]